jgi:DNA mismatch repair endonuclease MutH
MQLAFGRMPDSRPAPDLDQFRIEVKTVPVSVGLASLQPTRVCRVNPQQLCDETEWARSHAFRKLTTILVVPVVNHPRPASNVAVWYARSPFVWMPSADEMSQLEEDWLGIRDRYANGTVNKSNIPGTYMFAKPQAPDATAVSKYVDLTGIERKPPSKAFYLKQRLTTATLRKTIGWESLVLRPEREPVGTVVATPDAAPDF